jgi:hypothetical protein
MMPPPRLRPFRAALALTLGLSLLHGLIACAARPPSEAEIADAEIRAEFRDDLDSDMQRVQSLLDRTREGKNLSELTLGWFVLGLLSQLSGQDKELFQRFHPGDSSIESYLRNRFRTHPDDEIAPLLADTPQPAVRRAAGYALQALTVIPDAKDSPAQQAECRSALAASLESLHASLIQARSEADAAPR